MICRGGRFHQILIGKKRFLIFTYTPSLNPNLNHCGHAGVLVQLFVVLQAVAFQQGNSSGEQLV